MELNTAKAHCLCRPLAVRLNLILMRDGESYVAQSHLSSWFLYLTEDHVQVNPASGYTYRFSQSKETAWHWGCQIKTEEGGLAQVVSD